MNLEFLRSFLRVADCGNVTRAAKSLMVTQPALTRQIRALETDLDAVLLERTRRGVYLTETGKALLEYAKRFEALERECRQTIRNLHTGTAGQLLIGAGI